MKRRLGFTLLEVLVALAIFALAAIVMGAAYVNVLMGYKHAERATQIDADVTFAREILFRMADVEKVKEGGDFETVDGRRVEWTAQVEPTTVADLFEVQFVVKLTPRTNGEAEVVTESFRLLRPTWSEDAERDQLRQESRERITKFLENRKS